MGQNPLSGAGEERPLAPDQLRFGKSVCGAEAPIGGNLAEGRANKVPGTRQRATPVAGAPAPANLQLSTRTDPVGNRVRHANVNESDAP